MIPPRISKEDVRLVWMFLGPVVRKRLADEEEGYYLKLVLSSREYAESQSYLFWMALTRHGYNFEHLLRVAKLFHGKEVE